MKVLFGRLSLAWVATRTPRLWPRVVVMLLITLLVACESPEQKEARHYERGVALYEEGQDEKAMVEFRNVLRLNPKNADALYHTGLIHERAGQIAGAFGAFETAAAERPGFVAANVRLGNIALAKRELEVLERAVAVIEQAEPDNLDGLALKGALLLNRDDLEGARAAAEAVLARAPDHEQASALIVGVLLQEGRTNAALERLDRAIMRKPESADLLLLKLLIHESRGDSKGTAESFARLLDLDPSNVRYYRAFARFRQQQGDTSGAAAALREALENASDVAEVAADLARLVYRTEGAAAAEATLKDLIERRPDDLALRLLLAELYAQQQQPVEAEAVLHAVIEGGDSRDATNDARVALARLKLAGNDPEAANTLVAEALKDDPSHPGALVFEGTVALDNGRLDDAIRSARTALRHDPAWPPALRLVAEVHERKGEMDLAIDALRDLLELEPQNTRSAEHLAELLVSRGDVQGASKVWDHIIATATDPSSALRARAAHAIQEREFDAARADIDRLLDTPGQEATASLLRGYLAVARNRLEEGRQWFARAETLAPDSPAPMIGITHAFVVEGDLEGALDYLGRRTRERPDDAAAFNLKAEILARAGRLEEAEAAWAEAIRLQPESPAAYSRLAKAQLVAGRLDDAIATYAAALEKIPHNTELMIEFAQVQYTINRSFDEALRMYERLLELKRDDDVVVNNYAALIADLRYEEPAVLDRAIALAERFRMTDNPYFLDTLGWLYYRKGDAAAATTFLDRAVTLTPDNPQFRYHLGMALYASGRKRDALSHLEQAVPDDADYPGLDEARATLTALQAEIVKAEGSGDG